MKDVSSETFEQSMAQDLDEFGRPKLTPHEELGQSAIEAIHRADDQRVETVGKLTTGKTVEHQHVDWKSLTEAARREKRAKIDERYEPAIDENLQALTFDAERVTAIENRLTRRSVFTSAVYDPDPVRDATVRSSNAHRLAALQVPDLVAYAVRVAARADLPAMGQVLEEVSRRGDSAMRTEDRDHIERLANAVPLPGFDRMTKLIREIKMMPLRAKIASGRGTPQDKMRLGLLKQQG